MAYEDSFGREYADNRSGGFGSLPVDIPRVDLFPCEETVPFGLAGDVGPPIVAPPERGMHLPPEGHDVSVDDPLQAEAEGTSTTQESLGTTVDANVAKRVGKITTEGQVAGSDEKHPPQDIEPDVPPMTGGAGGDGGEPPHDDPPPLTPGSPPEDGGKDMDGQASWPASDNTGEHSPGDSVGGFLGVLRKDNGVAVAQLAERVDMSSSTLYRYFNGESHPNRQGVEAIARAFGLDPAVTDQLVTAWRAEKAGNHDEAKRILSGIQLPKS